MTVGGELAELLGRLRPVRRPDTYVFVTVTAPPEPSLHPVMTFTEDEGLTLVLDRRAADVGQLTYDLVTAWITLTVHSALAGVGLTAAVSRALADAGISCNVIAAAFHDHLFVPAERADDAVRILTDLSARHRRPPETGDPPTLAMRGPDR